MGEDFLPRRIASLQPSATDTLARLGLLDRVVACTRYCAEVVPDAARASIVISDSWSVTADEIVAAHPDLVIASVPYQPEAVAQILKSGARFLGLAPKCLEDVYADIAAIAGITGSSEPGMQIIAEMQNTIEAVRRAAATSTTRPRVFCEEWGKPIIASEPWVAELIAAAGGEFVGDPGRQADPDTIRAAAPEVIIFAWAGAGDRVPAEKVIAERAWEHTPAARAGHIYVLHDAFLNTPSAVLVEGIKTLAWAIHPELFAPAQPVRQVAVV